MAAEKDAEPKVHVIRKEERKTRQKEDVTINGIVEPPISFASLELAYDNSYIIGGIFEKLATAANSGLMELKDKELEALLRDIDWKNLFENMLVYGNFFMEKLMGWSGKLLKLYPFLTDTMNAWHLGGVSSYVQTVSGSRVFFLPEEIVHLKTSSLKTKYYGESRFSKAVDQILLLAQIDQYYSAQFDRGMLNVSMLVDKGIEGPNGKRQFLSDENVKALKAWMKDNLGGLQNSFNTSIVPGVLERLDLSQEVDATAFIEYRRELQESIAIALNIPIDMLTSKNSNRSTSDTAFKTLVDLIVVPMQDSVIRELKMQLRKEFGNSVDEIAFNPIVIIDQKEDMEILVGYKKAGIMTANEVRAKLGLPEREDGNKLEVAGAKDAAQTDAIAKEEMEIKKAYAELYGE